MRSVLVHFIFILLVSETMYGQKSLTVPLKAYDGDGVFGAGRVLGKFVESHEGFKIDSADFSLFGLWKFPLDPAQNAFTEFIKGNRRDSNFLRRMNDSRWDTTKLSKDGYDNSLYVLSGIKRSGEYFIIPDLNFNKSFIDDSCYTCRRTKIPYDSIKYFLDNLPILSVHQPFWENGHEKRKEMAIRFWPKAYWGNLRTNWKDPIADSLILSVESPQHLEGSLSLEGRHYTVYAKNTFPDLRFCDISYVNIYISEGRMTKHLKPLSNYELYRLNDTVPVGRYSYKISYMDPFGESLELQYAGMNKGIGIDKDFFAENFVGNDVIDHSDVGLERFRGYYLLLDFWGTWCEPCKETLPGLKKINESYFQRRLRILSIALDKDSEVVKNYISSEHISWSNLFVPMYSGTPKGNIINTYKIENYPTFILIDPKGKIIFRDLGIPGFRQLENTLEKMFK
ncbi:MAG TPA: TlpA disulfide reductase family protein [Puia sp.]|nr:TlpA disulfide reductase family protein [Puia sp.]